MNKEPTYKKEYKTFFNQLFFIIFYSIIWYIILFLINYILILVTSDKYYDSELIFNTFLLWFGWVIIPYLISLTANKIIFNSLWVITTLFIYFILVSDVKFIWDTINSFYVLCWISTILLIAILDIKGKRWQSYIFIWLFILALWFWYYTSLNIEYVTQLDNSAFKSVLYWIFFWTSFNLLTYFFVPDNYVCWTKIKK